MLGKMVCIIAGILTSAKMWISHDKYTISEDNLGEKFLTWDMKTISQTKTIYRGYELVGDKVPVRSSTMLIHYCPRCLESLEII